MATRETRPQGELLRFALGPDGVVVPDLRGRLPGRGAWTLPTAAAVREAVRRRAFARAFKREATAPATLAEDVDAALVRDLLGALAMANKAGAVTAGFAKVEAALASGGVAALLHAAEAAPDGRRKLAAAARAALRNAPAGTISALETFDDLPGRDLDVALGREGVVHAALLAGVGGEGCLARWRRLRRYRGADGASAPDGGPLGQGDPQASAEFG